MSRIFNTAGPCLPGKHYMLAPSRRLPEVADLIEELPVPREKAFQEALARESDSKAKSFKPADFVDLSFLRELDPGGLVDKLYRK